MLLHMIGDRLVTSCL